MNERIRAVYVISVAAELAGMHPQTLRIYERRGLLTPARTQGGNRRYSEADIARLRCIANLASTGMNLEGIRHVMFLEEEVVRLRAEVEKLHHAIDNSSHGALVPLRQTVAIYGQRPSIFDPNR